MLECAIGRGVDTATCPRVAMIRELGALGFAPHGGWNLRGRVDRVVGARYSIGGRARGSGAIKRSHRNDV